jgi:hypothetical protein
MKTSETERCNGGKTASSANVVGKSGYPFARN